MHVALQVGLVVIKKIAVANIESNGKVHTEILIDVKDAAFAIDNPLDNFPAHFHFERTCFTIRDFHYTVAADEMAFHFRPVLPQVDLRNLFPQVQL